MGNVTIVLADDHPIVRHGLRALLEAEPDFTVIGEAEDGASALDLIEQKRPDVLVIDVMMPGMTGLEAVGQVSRRSPNTRVLVLSIYRNEAYILAALRNGAAGYILKSTGAEELIQAVRIVASGRRYLCPPLSERAIEVYLQKAGSATLDVYETLTLREREVFQLIAEGHTSQEIGEKLSISHRTVEVHRTRIMQKLDLRNQTELIRFALRRGILAMEE